MSDRVFAALVAGLIVGVLVHWASIQTDFGVLYIAARYPADAYSLTRISAHFGDGGVHPFPYPPPMLALLRPLGLLDFHTAYSIWAGGSAALFAWLCVGRIGLWRAMLACIAVPTVWAALAGQTTLFLSSMTMMGATSATLLFKPQLAFLSPIAGAVRWRDAAFGAGLLALCLITMWPLWGDWLNSLPDFATVAVRPKIVDRMLLPAPIWIHGLVGVAALVLALSRTGDRRMIAVLIGSLLSAPYALSYDLAILMPFVLKTRNPLWIPLCTGFFNVFPHFSPLLLLAAL